MTDSNWNADALREHHSVAAPLALEIVATVRSVLSAK